MKIGFFLQNRKRGGLDTFVIQLIKHWPYKEDQITLYCNKSHPGLDYLYQNIDQKIRPYKIILYQDIVTKFKDWPKFIVLFIKAIYLGFGYFYQVRYLRSIFSNTELDKLLIINGGYPAGDVCLTATIVWGQMYPKKKAWHNFHNFSASLPKSLLLRLYESWIDKRVVKYGRGFISVSNFCINTIHNRPEMINAEKRFIYNGMEELFPSFKSSIKEELSLSSNSQLILMLGTYEIRKGHRFIINVMEHVVKSSPDLHLLICGDGIDSEVELVENLRDNCSVSGNIHLMMHRNDIENLFSQVELLVAPSQDYESFGYMALEAMCCKLPVIVTDVGGLPEVVVDGVCGYVVRKKDVIGFSKRIIKLIKNDNLRKSFGNAGYNRYLEFFKSDRMAKQYANLIRH